MKNSLYYMSVIKVIFWADVVFGSNTGEPIHIPLGMPG
jgi:hypothetical protein